MSFQDLINRSSLLKNSETPFQNLPAMSDVELGLRADLLPRYNETSDQNKNPEGIKPTVPATKGKRKQTNCGVSCHAMFWCILTIGAILYPAGILIMSFIKLDVIRIEPSIKDTVLARLWQGLMMTPIAIVAQRLMRPESPMLSADLESRDVQQDRTFQRRIFSGLLLTMCCWFVSLASFNKGPC
jgi:hypothetical protein